MENPTSNDTKTEGSAGETATLDPLKKIEELESLVKEKENKYLYLYAEFDNYKKRTIKERSDLIKFGWENVARDLLTVVDNLERALNFVPANSDPSLTSGLNLVLTEFKNTMKRQGVAEIPSLGQTFDPNLHEAVGVEKSEQSPGSILKEHQKGYTLHGRLLRPSRVILSE